MDEFDALLSSIIPSDRSILQQVDEFTLYCFYTGIDPIVLGKAYSAPYRKDDFPSFSIFRASKPTSSTEYLWKDHKTTQAGNIFTLIGIIEQLSTKQEVYARINEDFGLNYSIDPLRPREKIIWNTPVENSESIKIRVAPVPLTEAGLSFWRRFDIHQDRLDKYNTEQIKWYWSHDGQTAPVTVPDPTFSYRVGEYYQIYSPFASKLYKFRNDLPENYFFGYLQLPQNGSVLIIDKSSKDVIFCDRLNYPAVAGKSETTMIPDYKMLELKERFTDIYLTLDPDEAGRKQTIKYMEKYPWLKPRFLPEYAGKDKTDTCIKLGIDEATRIIGELLR